MTKLKPSQKIQIIAQKIHNERPDPGFSGGTPDNADYVCAIVQYLDEEDKK